MATIYTTLSRGNKVEVTNHMSLTYDGFPISKPNSVYSQNENGLSLIPISVEDTYPGTKFSAAYQGFYLQATTVYRVGNSNIFVDSNSKTRIGFKQGIFPLQYYDFYYQNVATTPIVTSCEITLNTTVYITISGIKVIYGTILLNATTFVENLGGYFYNKDQILKYSTGASETGLTNVNSTYFNLQLMNSIKIENKGTPQINYLSSAFSKNITITTTAYNVKDETHNITTSINAIIDNQSYNLISNISLYPNEVQVVGNNGFIVGCRVWSDTTPSNATPRWVTPLPTIKRYVDIIYDHNWDLSTPNNSYDATQELQIFNGTYGSKGGTTNGNGYLDYRNYKYFASNTN